MMRKRGLFLLFLFIPFGLILLASSLHDVRFQPGRSLPAQEPSANLAALPDVPFADVPVWKVILFWFLFASAFTLLVYFLSPELRKRLMRQIIGFAVGLLAIYIAFRYRLLQIPVLQSGPPVEPTQVVVGGGGNPPLPVFQPPVMAAWMLYVVSLLIMLAFLTLAWVFYCWWMRNRPSPSSPLSDLAGIARASLNDLYAGRRWSDVIIECYLTMSEVVARQRGLERGEAMTAREFAIHLERAGLPTDAVADLTRLFESVRYGVHSSEAGDIHRAQACLTSIVRACGMAQ